MKQEITPRDFKDQALDMIDFFGGYVTQERNWEEECKEYFLAREIPSEHWDTIYYESLQLMNIV